MPPVEPGPVTASHSPAAPLAGFEATLARLRGEFAQKLPARLEEAQTLMRACQADPQDTAPLARLQRLMHILAGSAGTFGLSELGRQALLIERQLLALQAHAGRTGADFDTPARDLQRLANGAPRL